MFRDAQGRKIEMSGCRDAHVLLGDVSFTETFAVGPVTAPLLAMGKLVKAGWSLELSGSEPALVKGDCRIDVHYRRNSLCAYGSIRAISAESKRDDLELHVRRAVLSDALAAVGAVWNQTADDIFAIRSFGDAFLNIEECLHGVGCRFRTTIIYDDGDWQLVEFGQDISELQTPAGPIPAIEGVVDILTLAHRRRFKPEQMGFEAIFVRPRTRVRLRARRVTVRVKARREGRQPTQRMMRRSSNMCQRFCQVAHPMSRNQRQSRPTGRPGAIGGRGDFADTQLDPQGAESCMSCFRHWQIRWKGNCFQPHCSPSAEDAIE